MKVLSENKITQLRKFFLLDLLLMTTLIGLSQLTGKADLSITSVSIADDITKRGGDPINAKTTFANLKCTITIHNESNSLANQTKLVVVLPVDITIVSNQNNSTTYVSGNGNRGGWPGSLLIDLFNVSPGQDRIIEFTFTRSAYGNSIGAYIFSGCPDPNPANNYKDATY